MWETLKPDLRETDAADLLAPEQMAARIAPVIDRLRLALHHSMQAAVAVTVRERGLDKQMAMVIGNLRNLAPGRAVARSAVEAVYIYAGLAARAVRAAAVDGGDTFSLLAPSQEPADASEAALLSERLTGLRFHRFDAHVAAWRAAGLTADQIKALRNGPARAAIEAETNRRASTPYATLDPAERLELLAGLGALPG